MYRCIHRVNSAYPKPFIHRRSLAFQHGKFSRRRTRKVLPPELSRNVVRLTCESRAEGGICDVYLVGVVHRYPKSCQDVKNVINFLKPQVVFLELCSARAPLLYTCKVPPTGTHARDYYDEVLRKYEGSELRMAFNEANKYGAKVILGDRPWEITEKIYEAKYSRMSFWQFIKMRLSRIRAPKKKLSADDAYNLPVTRLNELSRRYYGIFKEVHIDERDQYMSAGIQKAAGKHNVVVAVVGKYHLLGIQKYWKQHIEVKQLLSIPPSCNHRMDIGWMDNVGFN